MESHYRQVDAYSAREKRKGQLLVKKEDQIRTLKTILLDILCFLHAPDILVIFNLVVQTLYNPFSSIIMS